MRLGIAPMKKVWMLASMLTIGLLPTNAEAAMFKLTDATIADVHAAYRADALQSWQVLAGLEKPV